MKIYGFEVFCTFKNHLELSLDLTSVYWLLAGYKTGYLPIPRIQIQDGKVCGTFERIQSGINLWKGICITVCD